MSSSHPPSFEAPAIEELQPLFPAYEIEGLVAQGGMGAVYRARQTSLDRVVAIKILPREFGETENFRESFVAEARAMAKLNHPNLVGVYDFGDADGMLYIVMEFVDGSSLHDAAGTDPIEPTTAVELLKGICRGLAHAHEHGVLHRDIKPANILLDAKRRPKIGDFGLAGRIGEQVGDDEEVFGTPGYAAPEVVGGGVVDERSDIFALGVLLHRLLTGVEPDGTSLESASALCGSPLPLDKIIGKATEVDPEDRFATAGQLVEELEQSNKAKAKAVPVLPRPVLPKPTVGASPVSPPVSTVPAPRERREFQIPGQAIAAVLIAAAVVGGFFYFTKGDGNDQGVSSESSNSVRVVAPKEKPKPKVEVVAPTEKEPESKGLAQLKEKLLKGDRSEFPEGTVQQDGSYFLVIDQLMTWEEAESFAEDHGGHLAVLPSLEMRQWLQSETAIKNPVWLGVGKEAEERWRWIDETPWDAGTAIESTEAHRYLAYSSAGDLFPAKPAQKFGLVVQWRADGSNPGTLEAQLASLAKTQGESKVYPLGTKSWNDSHYYLLEGELGWDEARKYAKSLGAYLAVPGSKEEQEWMVRAFSTFMEAGRSAWLGGFQLKENGRWQWLTGERWNNSGWSALPDGDPKLNRVALARGQAPGGLAWIAREGAKGKAQSFLLEWSAPRTAVAVTAFDPTAWLEQVNRKMANTVSRDLDNYEKDRKKVVLDYSRLMNRIVRKEEDEPAFGRGGGRGGRFPFGNRRAVAEIKEDLKLATKENRLIDSLPEGVSRAFREQQEQSRKELKVVGDSYDLKLSKHRDFYIDGIQKKALAVTDFGFIDAGRELTAHAEIFIGDNVTFLDVLFAGTPRAKIPWVPLLEGEEPEALEIP